MPRTKPTTASFSSASVGGPRSSIVFTIRGIVRDAEGGLPLPGLFVKAYDKDLLFDDLLGSAFTDALGRLDIVCELSDFREFFDVKPDLYFKVYRDDRTTLLVDTESAVRWNAGRLSDVEILIPAERFEDRHVALVLSGDDESAAKELEIGESLTFAARGLRPRTAYDVEVLADGRTLFSPRILTNARGAIEPTILWPQLGFDDPAIAARFTIDEAIARWGDVAIEVRLFDRKRVVAKASVRLGNAVSRPLVLATDQQGRLLNAVEVDKEPLVVTVRALPFEGDARLIVVPRQHDWRVGDDVVPALFRDGRPMTIDFVAPARGAEHRVDVAAANALAAGAYDFIVRPIRYGYEENDARRLLARDIAGSKRLTGVVIREGFWTAKPVLGGCVNKIQVSGRAIPSGTPYFRYSDAFAVGEDVWAALDPGIVDPGNVGKMCALYVVQNKNAAQWNASNGLTHLVGGNGAVQKLKVQSGCVNANKRLVWPAAPTEGDYDLVADFGNNTPDANAFVPNDQYNTPLDIIDGYFNVGFKVVRDPGTMSDFANVGSWEYDENTVGSLAANPTVTVQDEVSFYASPGAIATQNVNVALRAHVRFPADAPGATQPSQISAAQASFPLVCIVHGNGHSYTSYDFLLDHLAHNGFIAASIHLNGGMAALGRANVFFEHMTVLQGAFTTHLQNAIGVMGHSRGGEAVVKIARLNQQQSMGLGIQAVMSLAPTDQYGREVMSGGWAVPYFVLYGSADGDVAGWATTEFGGFLANLGFTWRMTGFSLFDRAAGMKKSMAFVYGATHNGFITTNEAGSAIPEADQKKVTLGYTNAFFRQHLRNEPQWAGMFTGEWRPPSVTATGARLFVQYRDPSHVDVDTFEGLTANWQQSTIGGMVGHGGTLPADPTEARLNHDQNAAGIDAKSPHDTKGLLVRWDTAGDRLDFDLPAPLDVSSFNCVSIRITQRADSIENAANQPQNMRLVLRGGNGKERAIRVSAFGEVPFPDVRPYADLTKSALSTIRIPLTAYTIVCAGMDPVQLTNLTRISLLFSETSKGEIEIDDLEFTN